MKNKRVFLEQGSPEWLEWRGSLRTASETPTVMNVNPYQSQNALRKQKAEQKPTFVNEAMVRGSNMEPIARAAVGEELGISLEPRCYEMGLFGASLDAFGELEGVDIIVEIKCPSSPSSAYWDDLDEKHPTFWQLVHQKLCSGAERTFLYTYDEGRTRLQECHITEDHFTQLIEAWNKFESERVDEAFGEIATKYKSLKKQEKAIKAQLDATGETLKDQGECFGFGVAVSTVERKGSLNLQKLEEEDPNLFKQLEPYFSKSSSYKKINITEAN
jgi:putative phage-type endonuclease